MKDLNKSDFDDCAFYTTYRMKFILSNGITKLDDVIERLETLVTLFKKWRATGVMYEQGAENDYAAFSVKGINKAIELGFDLQDKDGSRVLDYGSGQLFLDDLNDPIKMEEFPY